MRRYESNSGSFDWPKDSIWREPTIHNFPPSHKGTALEVIPVVVVAFICVGGMAIENDFIRIPSVIAVVLIFAYIAWRNQVTGIPFWGTRKQGKDHGDFTPELTDDPVVNLCIYVDAQLTGRDQGVLAFEEDALFFAGNSSSFLIGIQDIDLEFSFEKLWKSNVAVPFGGFLIRVKHPKMKLELVAIHTEYAGETTRSINPDSFMESIAIHPEHGNESYASMTPNAIHIQSVLRQARPTKKPRSYPPITLPVVTVSE